MQEAFHLSQMDMRYLATGCNSSLMYDEQMKQCKMDARETMRKTSIKEGIIAEIPHTYLKKPYPRINNYFHTDIFTKPGDVQRYFENLGDIQESPENQTPSHNIVLYNDDILKASNNKLQVLFDNEVCAVKVSDLKTNQTWGLGGIYKNISFDTTYFEQEIKGRYALTHGRTKNGLVIVRTIQEHEFERFKNWFEKIHKEQQNPFVKNFSELEKMLK